LAKGIARAKFSDRGQWRDVADFVGSFNHHQACGGSRIRCAGAVAWTPFVYCWNARPSPSVIYAQIVGVAWYYEICSIVRAVRLACSNDASLVDADAHC
jgi:hypothetical protein